MTTTTHTYGVEGMHCAGCVARVEKALGSVAGVEDASVSLPTASARVLVGEGFAGETALVEAVERIGFKLSPQMENDRGVSPTAIDRGGNDHAGGRRLRDVDREAIAWRWRFWASLALLVPIGALQMVLHFNHALAAIPALWIALLMLATAALVAGGEFFVRALKAARVGAWTMDVLVALGVGVAFVSSTVHLVASGFDVHGVAIHAVHYEAASMILTFLALGRWLEARSKAGAFDALAGLQSLAPRTAMIVRGDQTVEVPSGEVKPGDIIAVRAGEAIAADGIIVDGASSVDQSLVTGESIPVPRGVGDAVICGTVNGASPLRVRAERVGRDALLGRILQAVEEAQASKANVQRLVDQVTQWFVPAVIAIAAMAWIGAGLWGAGWGVGALRAAAVLVVACPCALGLATPMAIVCAVGAAARNGILIRDAQALEDGARVRTIIFDKTGTMTMGQPALVDMLSTRDGESVEAALGKLAALEAASTHPLARAIAARMALLPHSTKPKAMGVKVVAGKGVEGLIEFRGCRAGSVEWIVEKGATLDEAASAWLARQREAGATIVGLAEDGRGLAGLFAFRDEPRPSAAEAVGELQSQGLDVWLVTGDHAAPAIAVARAVGIADDHVRAGTMPDDKARIVAELRGRGAVAMVGDGVNDAPALALADLGIAMGRGTDTAVAAAPITLLSEDLRVVVRALALARAARRTMVGNLVWAMGYNVALLPLAAVGVVPMGLAALAMALSSVSVVENSRRLARRFKNR